VLGAPSDALRASESQKLLNFGFQAFDTVSLYQSGRPVAALKVWKGQAAELNAGFVADRFVTLPRGRAGDLNLVLESTEPLVAPVARGQRVGLVRVSLDGKPVAEFPLIALDEVPVANAFVRAWHSLRLWFR
jgi:D-alanyl-D-alanine carboxypeptidase (penicillin-binding protein 5/6)